MEDLILDILSCKSRRAALRCLLASGDDVTGRELARRTGFSHQQALNALSSLVELGVVERRVFGPAHLFRLNWPNKLAVQLARWLNAEAA